MSHESSSAHDLLPNELREDSVPEVAPLRLLHPVWCCPGQGCLDADHLGERNAVHRSKRTTCQTENVIMALNRIRYDTPRFIDGQRHEVNGQGEPAPERGSDRVELTLTQGELTAHAGGLGVPELQELIALLEQQLDHLQKGPFPRDYPREALTH
jgi:hypothetical protein